MNIGTKYLSCSQKAKEIQEFPNIRKKKEEGKKMVGPLVDLLIVASLSVEILFKALWAQTFHVYFSTFNDRELLQLYRLNIHIKPGSFAHLKIPT